MESPKSHFSDDHAPLTAEQINDGLHEDVIARIVQEGGHTPDLVRAVLGAGAQILMDSPHVRRASFCSTALGREADRKK